MVNIDIAVLPCVGHRLINVSHNYDGQLISSLPHSYMTC